MAPSALAPALRLLGSINVALRSLDLHVMWIVSSPVPRFLGALAALPRRGPIGGPAVLLPHSPCDYAIRPRSYKGNFAARIPISSTGTRVKRSYRFCHVAVTRHWAGWQSDYVALCCPNISTPSCNITLLGLRNCGGGVGCEWPARTYHGIDTGTVPKAGLTTWFSIVPRCNAQPYIVMTSAIWTHNIPRRTNLIRAHPRSAHA